MSIALKTAEYVQHSQTPNAFKSLDTNCPVCNMDCLEDTYDVCVHHECRIHSLNMSLRNMTSKHSGICPKSDQGDGEDEGEDGGLLLRME
ncbi:hypothetical protein BaRGS_00038888 [Batillaria attramentaria]|uniref:Uncharacterized protein n=1 Tax=Batillaria attramentaria TaxID=370345 RepID=A0ABD0J4J2_9CAEN